MIHERKIRETKFNLKLLSIITIILLVIAFIVWLILNNNINKTRDTYMAESQAQQQDLCTTFKQKLISSDKSATDIALIGEKFIDNSQVNLGISALEASIEKDNSIRDIALYTAKVYFDNHEYNKALEMTLHAQELDPVYWQTQSLLSEIYTALGDDQNSQICYNKANEFNPENHQ